MKLDIVFTVVLYNKRVSNSSTVISLIKNFSQKCNSKLIIWNNGKLCCDFDGIDFETIEVELIDHRGNESLAKIYNTIIDGFNSDKYVFFDDDSNVNKQYLDDIFFANKFNTCIPIITAESNIISPTVLKGDLKLGNIDNDTMLQGIGSGLVLSRYIIERIKVIQDLVFDERFYLYGVDTVFFNTLFSLKESTYITVIRGFEHDLSRLNNNNNSYFRVKERSYAFGLYCRYYPSFINLKNLLLLSIKATYKNDELYNLKYVYKAIVSGKHYRNVNHETQIK
ncbi:hypothetical protein ABIS04_05305 [Shewanella sp. H8]|uniref:hypothetical protein n=1 Tax=Shewanella sp. H8 TaxID=3342676 RepID=UPI003314E807